MDPLEGHPLYQKVRTISRGQRSFVQVARNVATGEFVAIKFIPRGWAPSQTKYVTREILNHQELSLSKHPHVVEFKEVFLTSRYLAEVMEYVEGETLQVFLEKVGGKVIEGLARFIFQQLIIALDFCHRKGKVNRDIKLSNILLSIAEGQLPLVKLCDFGVSKDTYRHSEPHSQVGTALFVAPEVMQNFSGGRYDGQAADIWACGVCLFIMLFGRHPYLRPEDSRLNEQQQMIKLFQRMMQGQVEFPTDLATSLSQECVDLLARMLKTDPNQRFTMASIQRHPWFMQALPEGADLMNDMFLAEESAALSPQSQSQIEQLVALAARAEEAPPTRIQLPSQVRAAAAGSANAHPAGMPMQGLVRMDSSGGGALSTTAVSSSAGVIARQQQHQHQQLQPAQGLVNSPSVSSGRMQAQPQPGTSGCSSHVHSTGISQRTLVPVPPPTAHAPSVGAYMDTQQHSHRLQLPVPPPSHVPMQQPGLQQSQQQQAYAQHMYQQQQQQQQQQQHVVQGLQPSMQQQMQAQMAAHPQTMAQQQQMHMGVNAQQQQQMQSMQMQSVQMQSMQQQQQQQHQQYFQSSSPSLPSQMGGSPVMPHTQAYLQKQLSVDAHLQQQQMQQQQLLQQQQQQQAQHETSSLPPRVSSTNPTGSLRQQLSRSADPMNIPDLDEMIMSMPETALLQAATIDVHATAQQQQQLQLLKQQHRQQLMQQMQTGGGSGASFGSGSGYSHDQQTPTPQPMQSTVAAAQQQHMQSMQAAAQQQPMQSMQAAAQQQHMQPMPAAAQQQPMQSMPAAAQQQHMQPMQAAAQQQHMQSMQARPAAPQHMGSTTPQQLSRPLPPQVNSIANLAPGSMASLPSGMMMNHSMQFKDSGSGVLNRSGSLGPGGAMATSMSGHAPLVDTAPFLYEGNDDDLPMVGSVSAVMPKFDWGSFNAPLLADSFKGSQHYNDSRFTQVCRHVSAKVSEGGLGPGAGPTARPSPLGMSNAAMAPAMNLANLSVGQAQHMGMPPSTVMAAQSQPHMMQM